MIISRVLVMANRNEQVRKSPRSVLKDLEEIWLLIRIDSEAFP